MNICLFIASWIVWLALGTCLTWVFRGDKAFSFVISFLAVALCWMAWFMFPPSGYFL
ncbi:hypothetical protein IFY47_003391 [Salmonella enterica]|nr:hypothetical protein [Escherichia coli]EGK7902762.1 hypothetical protein [Salmonella enterica]EHF0215334.1 hypothetical protein [Salmonella enterica]EJD1942454.1 hypothetical protein [Escherichia coli]EJM1834557.1 hypothetical protein [Salmonella enterica]